MKACKQLTAFTAILPALIFSVLTTSAGGKTGYSSGHHTAYHAPDRVIFTDLFSLATGNSETYQDGLLVRYNNGYLSSTADDDQKQGKTSEYISSHRDGTELSEERRPFFTTSDTIFLRLSNILISDYRFKIHMQNFSVTGLMAKLEDHYLHTSRVLDTYGNTDIIDFSVSADPASADPFRFSIVFVTASALPVTLTEFSARAQGAHVALQWKVANQLNMLGYDIERSADGSHFTKLARVAATTTAVNTYSWVDDHALAGRNFYRIRCQGLDGSSRLSQVLGVKFGQTDAGISLYPNPVTNGVFTIQYSGMEKGTYQLRLLNNGGQLIFSKALEHSGSNASQTVSLPMPVVAANYYMEITGPGGYRHIEKLRIQNH